MYIKLRRHCSEMILLCPLLCGRHRYNIMQCCSEIPFLMNEGINDNSKSCLKGFKM